MKLNLTLRCQHQRTQAFISGDSTPINRVHASWKRQGADETANFMRGAVPVKTGFLRNSVTQKMTPKGFSVYPTASYAKYVDQDTKPHYIFAKANGVLRWYGASGKPIFAKYVYHPGTKGKQYLKRTRDAMKPILRQLYVMLWREQP